MTTADKLLPRLQQDQHTRRRGDSSAEEKAFQTLRARLAQAGHALSRMNAGDGPSTYYVTRWGQVRELCDLGAVAEFAKQVGGPIHG